MKGDKYEGRLEPAAISVISMQGDKYEGRQMKKGD